MKYIPGNIFVNSVVASLAEGASGFASGGIRKFLGPRNALIASFAVTAVAAVLLGVVEANPSWIGEIPPIIVAGKFAISCAFNLIYSCTSFYFESKFMGTVFGICNTVARFATIAAPMIAEAHPPTPVISIFITCLLASILSFCIREPKVTALTINK
jgi:hypothetical protein